MGRIFFSKKSAPSRFVLPPAAPAEANALRRVRVERAKILLIHVSPKRRGWYKTSAQITQLVKPKFTKFNIIACTNTVNQLVNYFANRSLFTLRLPQLGLTSCRENL